MGEEFRTILLEIQAKLVRQEEQIKTLFKQQDAIQTLTETVHTLAMSIQKQGISLQNTEKKVDGMKKDVDELKTKPAKRWEHTITVIITAVVTAIATFVLTKIGLK